MGRTVFDGFARWLVVDQGDVIAQRAPGNRQRLDPPSQSQGVQHGAGDGQHNTSQSRQLGLVPDCRSVWGDVSTVAGFERPETAPAPLVSPAVSPVPAQGRSHPATTSTTAVHPQVMALKQAAKAGVPFCEICERAKAEAAARNAEP